MCRNTPTPPLSRPCATIWDAFLLVTVAAIMAAEGGTVTTLAGSGAAGYAYGYADGPGTTALFFLPYGVAAMPNGSVVVADTYNNRIRLVAPGGTVTTLALASSWTIGVAAMQNGNVVAFIDDNLCLFSPDSTATTLAPSFRGAALAVMQNGSVVAAHDDKIKFF